MQSIQDLAIEAVEMWAKERGDKQWSLLEITGLIRHVEGAIRKGVQNQRERAGDIAFEHYDQAAKESEKAIVESIKDDIMNDVYEGE